MLVRNYVDFELLALDIYGSLLEEELELVHEMGEGEESKATGKAVKRLLDALTDGDWLGQIEWVEVSEEDQQAFVERVFESYESEVVA